jgi:D-alanyl-lipoteichoic acid acyltransferase DltB (MBOAT superfamily)
MSLAAPLPRPPLGAQSPAVAAISLRDYLVVLAQLALLLVLLRQFQIESAAFLRLALLAFAGFAVHALLPLRYRLPFFAALSLAGIGVALGLANAAWLIGIGLVLIGICHIPIAFYLRGVLLITVAAVLVAQRAQLVPFPWSEAIWPILGAMFMFRLIVYFYDLRHDKGPSSPVQSAAYFFMLPNACFPLFPVIDYKTFRRNYYDDDAYRIYQLGIEWMVRGVVHLLLYRVVYYYLTLAPAEVATPADLTQYVVTNFLLYLRVSGLFHLIVGMLYLFGFRLPETHNRWLLASSFTDFWRRINIYWKDFMQKVFYYPAIFRLRGLGTTQALIIATIYVFAMTWFLHAYQWFWLRGSMLLVAQDILFWLILGLLVVANTLYELKHGRKRSLAAPPRTWKTVAVTALKTYATFWAICVLWSFWTAESVHEWLSLWRALAGPYDLQMLLYPGLVLAVIVLGSVPRDAVRNVRGSAQERGAWFRAQAATVAVMVGLVAISVQDVAVRLGDEVATVVHSLRSGRLSRLDTAKLERGYYESLLSVDRFNSQLWEVYTKRPANWLDVEGENLKRFVGGMAEYELIPSFTSTTKYGPISTNRHGMRDREYAEQPAPGTFRAVVLGASSVMGWGVPDGANFESLIEQRLNAELAAAPFARYELLNMAIPGYDPPQQLLRLQRAFDFAPQAVIYVATGREITRATRFIARYAAGGGDIPIEGLRDLVRRADIRAKMPEVDAVKALRPHRVELLSFVYQQIARQARVRGAVPILVFLPQVREGAWQDETAETLRLAEAAGFVVINLEDVYLGIDIGELRLAEWDEHPNVRGHQVIAERLYAELLRRRDVLFAGAQ